MNKKELEKLGFSKEALEKAGLEPSVLDEIIVLHGKDIEAKKAELVTAGEKLTAAETQLTEANKTIDGFKKLDPEGIKQAATEWEQKAKEWEGKVKETETVAQKNLASLKFDHALDGALAGAKAKNPKAVKALLDMEILQKAYDDKSGTIIGFDEHLKPVKEANDYLFDSDTPNPKIVIGANNKSVLGDSVIDAARKAAGLPEPK